MINGDHRQPANHCSTCHDRGWLDDRTTAVTFLRPCPRCTGRREPVGAYRSATR